MWKCKKCGQTFYEKPLKHGFFIIRNGIVLNRICDGKLIKIS